MFASAVARSSRSLAVLGATVISAGTISLCDSRTVDSTSMINFDKLGSSKRGEQVFLRVTRFQSLKATGKKDDTLKWSPSRDVSVVEEVAEEKPAPECPLCNYCKSGSCGEKFLYFNEAVRACSERGECDSEKLNASLLDFIVCMEGDDKHYDQGISDYFLEMFDTFNPAIEAE
jgi:hypothetical protein